MKHGSTDQSIIIFSTGPRSFALSIDHIIEIINPIEVKKVPLAPASVDGVINVRDTIYPVINLSSFFNLDSIEENNDEERMILVKYQDTIFAIHVSRIETLTSYTSSQLIGDEDHQDDYTLGVIQYGDKVSAGLLALQPIIDSLKQEAFSKATS